MKLRTALRLHGHETVAFVGGGGKSTAMFRLADELAAGGRVITTTTTRIFSAQIRQAPHHLQVGSAAEVPELAALLERHRHVLVTGRPGEASEIKAPGVGLDVLRAVRAAAPSAALLIEADGSRMRPFKAPAAHEPVVPEDADLVVAVVGAEVVGQPMSEAIVHRPELVAALAGIAAGDRLTPAVIADVLAHPQGGRKAVPSRAGFCVLINKAETPERVASARSLAAELLARPGVDSVVVGAVAEADPAREVQARVAGVVLAAGASSRMGTLKPTIEWRGQPLIQHSVRAGIEAGLQQMVAVVGHRGDEVAEALRGLGVEIVASPDWRAGQSASVVAGLRAVRPEVCAVVFFLADQPGVSPDLVRGLVQRHRETLAPIVAPRANGRRGNPVLFDRAVWPELRALTGDTGGRPLFESHAAEVAWLDWDDSVLRDIDTPDDLRALAGGGA